MDYPIYQLHSIAKQTYILLHIHHELRRIKAARDKQYYESFRIQYFLINYRTLNNKNIKNKKTRKLISCDRLNQQYPGYNVPRSGFY